jgi:predicted Zn-dependent peptidase
MRSDWYGQLEVPLNRASALSHAVLFDGNFESVYDIPEELAKVTPEQVKAFAAKYLVNRNRTIIDRTPAASPNAQKPGAGE